MTTGEHEVEQLQQEIEQTREQLGETVGQLAAKADIKSQAKNKASEVAGRMKTKVGLARQQASSKTGVARGQLAERTATVKQKARPAWKSGKQQITAAGAPVWNATPEPVRNAVAKGANTAKERRVPIAIAVGALVAGLLVIRKLRSR